MRIFCGIDWAENHHDVALVDETGALVAKRRICDDAGGLTDFGNRSRHETAMITIYGCSTNPAPQPE